MCYSSHSQPWSGLCECYKSRSNRTYELLLAKSKTNLRNLFITTRFEQKNEISLKEYPILRSVRLYEQFGYELVHKIDLAWYLKFRVILAEVSLSIDSYCNSVEDPGMSRVARFLFVQTRTNFVSTKTSIE